MTVEVLMTGRAFGRGMLDVVRLAEDNGYDTVWLADERFHQDSFGYLAYLAANTSRIHLGPCVTDPFSRHPALTAVSIATLDEISEGRAVLGIGAGISGFRELGIEPRKAPAAMREAVMLIRRLLAGKVVDFKGEIITFEEGKLSFKPYRPEIPVHLASNGPLGQRIAGAVADAAIMAGCGFAGEVTAFRNEVETGARKAGRDPAAVKLTARLNTCIAPDGKAARDAVRLSAARYMASGPMKMNALDGEGLTLPAEALAKVANLPYSTNLEPYRDLLPLITDRHVDACTLAGTVEEVTAHVVELRAAGIDSFIIAPVGAPGETAVDTMLRFSNEVWPAALDVAR